MSRKHFSWLLVLTVAVTAVVLLMPGKTGKESGFERHVLLPGLAEQVNELEWLRVTEAGGAVVATLARDEDGWTVEEAHGYRADWNRLRALLSDLARAEVIEPKTSNPEYYDRLGVEDVSGEDAYGTMLEFAEGSGLPHIIVGREARGREGQYVRLGDSAVSALIDRSLDIPSGRSAWLDNRIVDIADDEVVEVGIDHPDGESIRALKASADDENFELQGVPEGREIRSEWTVNTLAGGMAALTLEEAVPEGRLNWDGATRYRLVTADGLLLDAMLLRLPDSQAGEEEPGEVHWLRLEAGVYTTSLERPAEDAKADAVEDEATQRAREINARVSGWAYRIPQYKFDPMSKRMEDLLKAVESS
jgi:hypothetical protein